MLFNLICAQKLNKIFLAWQGHRVTHALFINVKWKLKRIGQEAIVVSHVPIYPVQPPNYINGLYRRHSYLPVSRCQVRARNRESRSRKTEWGSQISHVRSWRPPTRLVGELFSTDIGVSYLSCFLYRFCRAGGSNHRSITSWRPISAVSTKSRENTQKK